MTLIDKAEALVILAPAPNAKDGLWARRKKSLYDKINALPERGLPTDCRKWPFYPIPMPTTKYGKGPATIGVDAASISYEVWDNQYNTHASFENLPDAINEAMRLSMLELAKE